MPVKALAKATDPPVIAGRIPRHDLDAEAAVLSAILLEGPAVLRRLVWFLRPEHFYSDANGRIYQAACDLFFSRLVVDIVTVAGLLRAQEVMGQVGGPSYLAQLADATPATAHVVAHAQVVYWTAKLRELCATCQRISAESYGDVGVISEFLQVAMESVRQACAAPALEPLSFLGLDGEPRGCPELPDLERAAVRPAARVAAVAILRDDQGRLLSVSRKGNQEDLGLSGGRVEAGEGLEAACLRELREETGLVVLSARYAAGLPHGDWVAHAFFIDRWEGEPRQVEQGVQVRWVEPWRLTMAPASFRGWTQRVFPLLGIATKPPGRGR